MAIPMAVETAFKVTPAHATGIATKLGKQFPESGEYLTALGAAQYLNDDFSTSIATLQQAETKSLPQNSSHELWQALAYLGRADEGDLEQAQAIFQLGKDHMQAAAPGRGASTRPSRRSAANRVRHFDTVLT